MGNKYVTIQIRFYNRFPGTLYLGNFRIKPTNEGDTIKEQDAEPDNDWNKNGQYIGPGGYHDYRLSVEESLLNTSDWIEYFTAQVSVRFTSKTKTRYSTIGDGDWSTHLFPVHGSLVDEDYVNIVLGYHLNEFDEGKDYYLVDTVPVMDDMIMFNSIDYKAKVGDPVLHVKRGMDCERNATDSKYTKTQYMFFSASALYKSNQMFRNLHEGIDSLSYSSGFNVNYPWYPEVPNLASESFSSASIAAKCNFSDG